MFYFFIFSFYFFKFYSAAGFSYTMVPQESAPKGFRNETNGRDVGLFIIRRKKEFKIWECKSMEILDDRGAVQSLNRRQNESIITKMFVLYCSTDVVIVVTNDDIVICKEERFSRIVWGISRLYRMPPVFFPCRGIGVSAAVIPYCCLNHTHCDMFDVFDTSQR